MSNDDEVVIVTAHYKEDLRWLVKSPYKVFVCGKIGAVPIDKAIKKRFNYEPLIYNIGFEASSYLHYIIQHYNDLPPYIAFIHGHASAWHQRHPLGILGAIRTAKRKEFGYISLNVKTHPDDGVYDLLGRHKSTVANIILRQHWDNVFKPYLEMDLPNYLCHDSCAQFIVSRDVVLRHPPEAYHKWFDFANTRSTIEYPNKAYAVALEFIWHVIFGEQPVCPQRNEAYLRDRFTI